MISATPEQCTLPTDHCNEILNEIVKERNIQDGYKLHITPASSKGENYLGELLRIKITGKMPNSNEEKSFSLVLKLAPSTKSVREVMPVNKFYKAEYFVYSTLLPVFDKLQENTPSCNRYKHPKFYKGCVEDCKELIFLEDMSDENYIMFDRLKPLDNNHTELAIRKLAAYHAASFVLKQKDPEKYLELSNGASRLIDFGESFDKFLEETRDRVVGLIEDKDAAKRLQVFGVDIHDKLAKLLNPDEPEEYSVLCHGDCWTNNFLFKYKNNVPVEMCMLDWQILRLASPITDLAYFIFSSTDQAFRQQHLEHLFDLYHETLSARISDMGEDIEVCYPAHVFRTQIKKYLVYGLIMAMVVIPFTQSERGEAPDMTELLKSDENEKKTVMKYTNECVRRLREVVHDFVDYGMI